MKLGPVPVMHDSIETVVAMAMILLLRARCSPHFARCEILLSTPPQFHQNMEGS